MFRSISIILQRFFLVVALLMGASSYASTEPNSCALTFEGNSPSLAISAAFPKDVKTLQAVQNEVEAAKTVGRTLMHQFRERSERLLEEWRGQVVEMDVVCLGAGPQCTSVSLVLGKTQLKSLVVEKTEWVAKTFAEKDFFINSSELEQLSMHEFPGGVGSLSDFTSQRYGHSSELAAYIQSQQFSSGVPVLLNQEVVSIQQLKDKRGISFELKTKSGVTIRAKKLLFGTGLGEVATKVKVESYQEVFLKNLNQHEKNPFLIQKVMSTDTFLVSLRNLQERGTTLLLPRRIILIGDGDGSKIVLEAISRARLKWPQGFEVIWVGNTHKNAEEYVASTRGWDRYIDHIVPYYIRHQIRGVSGYIETWSQKEDGTFQMSSKDKQSGAITPFEGDMIIDSTGYTPTTTAFYESMGAQAEAIDVKTRLNRNDASETTVARQLVAQNQEPLQVFLLGPAAGYLATKEELQGTVNMNPVSIMNTVTRSSRLASLLVGRAPLSTRYGIREKRGTVMSAQQILARLGISKEPRSQIK